MAKISKGSRVLLAGTVTRVGEDGMISVKLDGLSYPVTLNEKYIAEVLPPKNPKRRVDTGE
jgi:preprotein translocase subunit YajC